MTDVVEKKVTDLNERLWEALTANVDAEGQIDRDTSIPAMLATLTTGSTWTTEGGVEVMVVRRDALSQVVREAFSDGYKAGVDEMSKLLSERSESMADAIVSAIRKE